MWSDDAPARAVAPAYKQRPSVDRCYIPGRYIRQLRLARITPQVCQFADGEDEAAAQCTTAHTTFEFEQ